MADSETNNRSGAVRLNAALDRSPVAMWTKDREGVITFANAMMASVLGVPSDGVVGHRTSDLVDESTARRLTSNDRRVLDGQELAFEEVIGDRCYLTHLVPTYDTHGHVDGIAGYSMEITERRRIEEALRRTEASLTEAEQISGIGSWEWDVQEDSVTWSDGMHRLYGISAKPTPPSYEAFLAATEEDDRDDVDAAMRDALAGLRPFEITHRVRRPSGEVRVMFCRAEVMRAPDGTPMRVCGVSQDVTELERRRNRAEDRVRHLEQAQRIAQSGSFEWLPESDELTMSAGIRDLLGARNARHGIDAILTALDPGARGELLEVLDAAVVGERRVARRITATDGRVLLVAAERVGDDFEAPVLGTVTDVSGAGAPQDATAGPLRARADVAELLARSDPSPAALVTTLAAAWPASRVELWSTSGLTRASARLEAGTDERGEALPAHLAPDPDVTAAIRTGEAQRRRGEDVIAVPIDGGGALVLHAARAADPEHAEGLDRIAAMIGTFLARRSARQELEHRAVHDPLTGLPNRALFLDRVVHTLSRMHRDPHTAALLFIDLDGIKHVNDVHGHAIGDELLRAVAARLSSSLRPDDTLARIGGDEFAILAERIVGSREALRLAERLLDSLRAPLDLPGVRLPASASIGINVFADAALTPDDVIDGADAAMYEAKRAGGARCVLADQRNS